MSKQHDVDIAPVGIESSETHADQQFASDLEKEPMASQDMQAGVRKADHLRAAWTKQGLVTVFSGSAFL